MAIPSTWTICKSYVNMPLSNIWFDEYDNKYDIFVECKNSIYSCIIFKIDPANSIGYNSTQNALDKIDFETNYKANTNPLRELDNRTIIHVSPRPMGTTTCFIGCGDDTSNSTNVGDGQPFMINHPSGTEVETVYIDFNVQENKTYILSGKCVHYGMDLDHLDFTIVPRVTEVTASSGSTCFNYGGYLAVPVPSGYGDIELPAASGQMLVEAVLNQDGTRPVGYWDATWNTETHAFSGITPNYGGSGVYNMFSYEVDLFRFVNDYYMMSPVGAGVVQDEFISFDAQQIGSNMRFKLKVTPSGDHSWKISAIVNAYREKTI